MIVLSHEGLWWLVMQNYAVIATFVPAVLGVTVNFIFSNIWSQTCDFPTTPSHPSTLLAFILPLLGPCLGFEVSKPEMTLLGSNPSVPSYFSQEQA